MAIRKRAVTHEHESRGRHPLLRPGLTSADIYNFIKIHPGCTREDIVKGTPYKHNQVTGRVAELKDNGLIMEGDTTVVGASGKRVKTLFITGTESGNRADRLQVELTILCNAHGQYFLDTANLLGEAPLARADMHGPHTLCLKKRITLAVTPPSKQLSNPANLQTVAKSGLLIEGDYEKVP